MKKFFVVSLCFVCLLGCSNTSSSDNDNLIRYMDAKEKIINDGAILVDVRSEEEYTKSHIDGALLLTLDTINEDTASAVIAEKDSVVIVYCQSGNRSQQAVEKLHELGYTEVYDLGSISNWEE